MGAEDGTPAARRRLVLQGLVQGVGFRPFVARLAATHGLAGSVSNGPEGVVIHAEGPGSTLRRFEEDLRLLAPPLAVISSLKGEWLPPVGECTFNILPSRTGGGAAATALIPPDVATCPACLAELRNPGDRRYRYPFINCTDCGPRYTIVAELPYDRPATTMGVFPMCPACLAEYEDPASRRYHAQPNACPACGPRARLLDAHGLALGRGDALLEAARLLAGGSILAVKGIGGFHLACDPTSEIVVQRLRERKGRPHKPLAVMVRDSAVAARLACLSERELDLLTSWRRPILLCQPAHPSPLADGVRAGSAQLGLFLPYSPLHHLLFDGALDALVMSSGNRTGEPLATDNDEALERLRGIADAFLVHDRGIHNPADDSVARVARGLPVLLRRGRGWAPQPVVLSAGGPCVLALGADLKGACCVTRNGLAFPGPCLGDLSQPDNLAQLERQARHLTGILGVRPRLIAHDLHPDYHSTRLAERLAREWSLPLLPVQHHHAHALSVLAEHGHRSGPVLAVCFDGSGLGTDGHVWGGEFLLVEGMSWRRLARMRELPMPGRDRAAREPWRMALAAMASVAGAEPESLTTWRALPTFHAVDEGRRNGVLAQLKSGGCPMTSSAGRLLDAAASILGLCQRMSFEGQAAIALEDAASTGKDGWHYPYVWQHLQPGFAGVAEIDTRPLWKSLLRDATNGLPAADCARKVHAALVDMIVEGARLARRELDIRAVALSGGVFQNRLLAEHAAAALEDDGFTALLQAQVSPNDEGVSLGQAWAGTLSLE